MIQASTTSSRLTASEAFAQIELRGISLTGWPGLRIWLASVELVRSKKPFTKAEMTIVSATGSTPIAAVEELVAKLEHGVEEQPVELFEFEEVER
ncbi:MAG: hypothetical protein MOB07_16290 [Acidobacteria bacterium]|nr:hypothetical protein [Acidobacteriota bacterium]